jgi:hypothetical protein
MVINEDLASAQQAPVVSARTESARPLEAADG